MGHRDRGPSRAYLHMAERRSGPEDASGVYEPTALGKAVMKAILATFSRAAGREVTPEELRDAHRALRERTSKTDAEAMVFLLDYLRKVR